MPIKIISGGQTGVDRAALDAAIASNFPCGGWCPLGRLAEDGVIPAHYPLLEMEGVDYRLRTEQNVVDSDGTVIIFFGSLFGGSKQTLNFCRRHKKPCLPIDGDTTDVLLCAAKIREFVDYNAIEKLNVAGPRFSDAPAAYRYAFRAITEVLSASS